MSDSSGWKPPLTLRDATVEPHGLEVTVGDEVTAEGLRTSFPGYAQRKVWAARLRAVADLLEEED